MNDRDINRENTRWDAIVIGSGIAGLTSAVTLARQGLKTLVLEQHSVPGGYASSFKRRGFTFDASLHQMPGLGQGQPIYNILENLGVMNKITPIPLEETTTLKTPVGQLTMGPTYLDQLREFFPNERQAIDTLENLLDNILKEQENLFKLAFLPEPIHNLVAQLIAPSTWKLRGLTLKGYLESITSEKSLQNLVAILCGYFGSPPSEISAILYLLAWGGFLREGIYYIKGSSQALSDALTERLEELGGQILLKQRVEKIVVRNNRVVGVRAKSKNGNTQNFKTRLVVSNANPFLTLNTLVGRSKVQASYLRKMESFDFSSSATCVYMGLDCKLSELSGEDFHSIQFFDDFEALDFDGFYERRRKGLGPGFDGLTDYSVVDPSLSPEGKSCLVAIRGDFKSNWDGSHRKQYKAQKQKVQEEIVRELETRFPGFSDHIEVVETATPLTMERYTSNHQGAFNGFAYTCDRVGIGKGGLDSKTPVGGLYLSSAWSGAMSGGFYGCIVHGYTTAKMISLRTGWEPLAKRVFKRLAPRNMERLVSKYDRSF